MTDSLVANPLVSIAPNDDLIARATTTAGADLRGWLDLAKQAQKENRLAEAEQLLLAADERFPDRSDVFLSLGQIAEARRDWVFAERWWRRFTALAPHIWWGFAGVGRVLREQGRVAEADDIAADLKERFSNEPSMFIAEARQAEQRSDWLGAARCWADIAVRFPRSWEGHCGRARVLREQGNIEAAYELLIEAVERFPAVTELLHDLARLAEGQNKWSSAERWWRAFIAVESRIWWAYTSLTETLILQRCPKGASVIYEQAREALPDENRICTAFIRALTETGYFEEARKAIGEIQESRFLFNTDELLQLGWSAIRCEKWDFAIDCLSKLQTEPRLTSQISSSIAQFGHLLKTRLAEVAPDMLAVLDKPAEPIGASREDQKHSQPLVLTAGSLLEDLLMRFESLGGDYPGCEIGLIQRKMGAEPLGLLRWTTTPAKHLIEAFQSQFDGVGSPQQTELYTTPGGDYKTRDKRFHMDMVTFVKASDISPSVMRSRAIKRISYLRGKLIQDLNDGQKIFVYRTYDDNMTFDEILQLKGAMGTFGENKLLYLKVADMENPTGSIKVVAPDVCFGYVERFSNEPVAILYMNGWLSVLRAAAAIWPGDQ